MIRLGDSSNLRSRGSLRELRVARRIAPLVVVLALFGGSRTAWAQAKPPAPAPAAPRQGAPPPAGEANPTPPAHDAPPPAGEANPTTPPTGDAAPPAGDATPPAVNPTPPPAGNATPPPAPPDEQSVPEFEVEGEREPILLRYTLEGIEIRGNTRTRPRVVLRYVPFKAGDIIDADDPAIELARYRLLGTGFFRDVQFSLRKGSARGRVVLVIEVVERNTIVVNDLWMGLGADADRSGKARPLTAYAGVDVAETNLAGTGITLGSAIGVAQDQLALRVRFLDPAFLGTPWMASTTLLYNDARDFFGNADVLSYLSQSPDSAVVTYKRFGGVLGVGRDLSLATQLWLRYRLESIDANYPQPASHLRGFSREPIDFHIVRGRSVLSALQATFQYDSRDQPFLPTRGWFTSVVGSLALPPLGSSYDYQRLDLSIARWWQLPWKQHVLKLEFFGGAITGRAPFFERYYVGDFSDFLPARELGANFDRRRPPNFFGTDIVEVRYGDFAAKLNAEYRIPLYRGTRAVYGIDFFGSVGLYGVAGRRDLTNPPTGYSGAALVPVDLTFNLGFRMDTSYGGFSFAFSNLLGFAPVRGQGPAGG